MTGDNTLIHSHGINRRDFMKLCAALAATMGLSSKAAAEMAESVTDRIIDFAIEAKYMPGLRNGITINDWR